MEEIKDGFKSRAQSSDSFRTIIIRNACSLSLQLVCLIARGCWGDNYISLLNKVSFYGLSKARLRRKAVALVPREDAGIL